MKNAILIVDAKERIYETSAKEPIEKGLHKIKNVQSCIFFIFLHRI